MTRALELDARPPRSIQNNCLRRNNVALFALYGGDFELAEKQAKEVLGLNKDYVKAHFVLAMAQLGTNRPAEAEAAWSGLAERYPEAAIRRRMAAQTLRCTKGV